MKRILIIAFAAMWLMACKDSKNEGNFVVEGQFENAANETLVLSIVKNGALLPVDSVETDKQGKFTLSGTVEFSDYALVTSVTNEQYVQLVVAPGEKIVLKGDWTDVSGSYTVSGSPDSELIRQLSKIHAVYMAQVDSLGAIFRANMTSPDFEAIQTELDAAYSNIVDNERKELGSFIRANSNSLAAMFALYQQMGPNDPVFEPTQDAELFGLVASSLTKSLPKSELVIQLNELLASFGQAGSEPGAVGSIATDIDLPSPDGKNIKLSSLRGKYVLLDFWAAWCRPCRMENPVLVDNYKKYNKMGFEIYQVSLDNTRDAWVKAIADDKLNWVHVSDLKYWQSDAARAYNITSIPASYLLDMEGRVIARNLRGAALGAALKEIFGE